MANLFHRLPLLILLFILLAASPSLIQRLLEGTLGTYLSGMYERDLLQDLFPFAKKSFLLLTSSMLIALCVGLLFGLFLYRMRLVRFLRGILQLVSVIPDFVLIFFLISGAIMFYEWTGTRIISISTANDTLWFPIMVLSFGPGLYLIKTIGLHYDQIAGEDFVRTAVAKGLPAPYIRLQHVFKNLLPFLLADVKKALSIAVANLFIVEYLINVNGITRFIFGQYQFTPVFVGLMVLSLLSVFVYGLLRGLIFLFERGFLYE